VCVPSIHSGDLCTVAKKRNPRIHNRYRPPQEISSSNVKDDNADPVSRRPPDTCYLAVCVSKSFLPPAFRIRSIHGPPRPDDHVRSAFLNNSIAIDDPQAPPRVQQHPHKRRFHAPPQILRTATRSAIPSHRACRRRHGRHPVTHSTRRVSTPPRSTAHATALIGLPASRARAILARRLPTQERSLFANTARGGGALRPRNVVLVQRQLPPIHPRTEAEIACNYEEEARQHAADNGADVGT